MKRRQKDGEQYPHNTQANQQKFPQHQESTSDSQQTEKDIQFTIYLILFIY